MVVGCKVDCRQLTNDSASLRIAPTWPRRKDVINPTDRAFKGREKPVGIGMQFAKTVDHSCVGACSGWRTGRSDALETESAIRSKTLIR